MLATMPDLYCLVSACVANMIINVGFIIVSYWGQKLQMYLQVINTKLITLEKLGG